MKLKLIQKSNETKGVRTFIFEPEAPLEWKAGQYLVYNLPHDNPDDRGTERFFTIASAPYEGHIQLTTRLAGEKGSSFKKALDELQVGSEIEALRVGGPFTVDDPDAQYVFIAGGIGVTPFRSILLDLGHQNAPINVTLLCQNRNDEIVFKSLFDELAQKHSSLKVRYLVDPQKIDETVIRDSVSDVNQPYYYISGPKPMVDHYVEMLSQMGIKPEKLKKDNFPGYVWPEPEEKVI